MRESKLYLNFLKRNLYYFFIPVILALLTGAFFYTQTPSKTKIYQIFRLDYNLDNINIILALTDQAVEELRSQRFELVLLDASVSIYKSAPLNITVEAVSPDRERSFALLLKEAEYLKQNFSASELTGPEIIPVEPGLLKYIISGLIIGGLIGLIISLVREYLKNY